MLTSIIIVLFGIGLCGLVMLAAAYYVQRRPQEVDPNGAQLRVPGSPERELLLPSSPYVASMRAHVDRRREELGRLLRTGELRRSWAARSESHRRTLLLTQRSEVLLAVTGFVGGDGALLQEVCPELDDDALERLALPGDAIHKLFQQLVEGKLGTPRGTSFGRLEALIATHLKERDAGKQDRTTRSSYLHVFRRSCLLAFAIAIASDGIASPKRAAERRTFLAQLGRGLAIWVLSIGAMRLISEISESIDFSAGFG